MTPYLPKCSAPLIFESEFEDTPYGAAGTGFLAKTFGRHYFVTAKHCLAEGDHNNLRVPEILGESELIKLETFGNTSLPEDEEDTDHGDFSMFLIASSFEPKTHRNALSPAHIPVSDIGCLLNMKIWLTVRGFPKEAPGNYVDYDRQHMSIQAVQCDASYIRPTESKYIHELKFIESCPVKDLDGMSGSPVFAKVPMHGETIYVLVGIMLRARRFLSIEVLKEGIRRFESA